MHLALCRPLTCLAGALLLAAGLPTRAVTAAPLPPEAAAALKAAAAGTTVSLPPGTFDIGELNLPAGISLQGAGFDRTILKMHGANGVILKATAGVEISDLTIRDAAGSNLLIENSANVTVRRVRLLGGLAGLQAAKAGNLRVECVVTAGNRGGVILNNCDNASVVNCTLVRSTAAGLSLSGGKDMRVFNNVFSSSPLGVVVAPGTAGLLLDHNLYQVSRIGKLTDVPPESVWSWRDQSGYDAHSVQLTVEFENEDAGNCKTVTPLAWAPGLPATALWGVAELGGVKAPLKDLCGMPTAPLGALWKKLAPVNVGAVNSRLREEAPDGTFEIETTDGLKSAALYTPAGTLVAWIFQTLPLPKGKYPYWLPSRDWQNRPIPAGAYELRITEADLRLKPVGNGLAGTTATSPEVSEHGAIQAQQPAFDSQGRLLYCMAWSESGLNVRAFDAGFAKQRWDFRGTTPHAGFAADGHGSVYSLRCSGKEYSLLKLDEETGATREFKPGVYILYFTSEFSDKVGGLAALGNQLFVADTGANKLLVTGAAEPVFKDGFAIPAPASPCADPQRNLIWVLSAKTRILGLNPADGSIKLEITVPVAGLHSFAITGDRLAVVSYTTGKVHLFDITDPATPKALNTVAAGFGNAPDTFLFKDRKPDDGALCRVALRADGAVAVADTNGVKFFAPDGTLARELTGGWYNSFRLGDNDPVLGQQVIDPAVGGRSWRLNALTGKATGERNGPAFTYAFHRDGVQFGLSQHKLERKPQPVNFSCISRIEADGRIVPALAFRYEGHPYADVFLLNGFPDGKIPETFVEADWQPVTAPDGRHIRVFNGSNLSASTNGDLLFESNRFTTIPFKQVSAQGIPEYDWAAIACNAPDLADLPGIKPRYSDSGSIISPHDGVTEETPGGPPNRIPAFLADGGPVRLANLKTGRMAALTGNWGATDAAAFDATGRLRWYLPLPEVNSTIGPYIVDDVIYLCGIVNSETQIVDRDGLILGRSGQPAGLPWGGKWLDNTLQFAAFKGNDGKPYVLYGNFNECCLYWFAVDGIDKVRKHTLKVTIPEAQSVRLATLPRPAALKAAQPPPTRITIKRVKEMTMDGDLKKWRALLPIPQAIVTPDSGAGIAGPADCSALLRFAHDGSNLYVQCIKFDNAVVMFQPVGLFYKQDGVEMAINSFSSGFKFNVTRVKDLGDIILRDRFYNQPPAKLLDAAKAPRRIDVLDNAATVPERKFIEDVYGVDLSKSKVIITEFKLPLSDDTYENDLKAKPSMTAGATLWLGLLIDDNDLPGGDVQNFLAWPATYGTFSSPETGALATFE